MVLIKGKVFSSTTDYYPESIDLNSLSGEFTACTCNEVKVIGIQ